MNTTYEIRVMPDGRKVKAVLCERHSLLTQSAGAHYSMTILTETEDPCEDCTPHDMNEYGVRHGLIERKDDGEYELTCRATETQDAVDNAIFHLVNTLVPFGTLAFPEEAEWQSGEMEPVIQWDMEWIAEIRESVQTIIYDRLKLKEQGVTTDVFEMHFYPYTEVRDDDYQGSTRAVASVELEFADVMHDRHAPELARNILRALVGECRSNYLATEGAEFFEDDEGPQDTGGHTKRITVRVGESEVSEVP
jgi:hypothetical protein